MIHLFDWMIACASHSCMHNLHARNAVRCFWYTLAISNAHGWINCFAGRLVCNVYGTTHLVMNKVYKIIVYFTSTTFTLGLFIWLIEWLPVTKHVFLYVYIAWIVMTLMQFKKYPLPQYFIQTTHVNLENKVFCTGTYRCSELVIVHTSCLKTCQ